MDLQMGTWNPATKTVIIVTEIEIVIFIFGAD